MSSSFDTTSLVATKHHHCCYHLLLSLWLFLFRGNLNLTSASFLSGSTLSFVQPQQRQQNNKQLIYVEPRQSLWYNNNDKNSYISSNHRHKHAPLYATPDVNKRRDGIIYDDENHRNNNNNNHQNTAPSNNKNNNGNIHIIGLLSDRDYKRFQGSNKVINSLPSLLENLLQKPLTLEEALQTFESNARVLIAQPPTIQQSSSPPPPSRYNTYDYNSTRTTSLRSPPTTLELTSSCQEIVTLASAMFWVVETSNRATNFAKSFGISFPGISDNDGDNKPIVHCTSFTWLDVDNTQSAVHTTNVVNNKNDTIKNSVSKLQVDWRVDLPQSVQRALNVTNLQGVSELQMSMDTGKILVHTIKNVRWNNMLQTPAVVWQALLSLQATVRNLQQSPFVQSFGSSPVLQQLQTDLVNQVTARSKIDNNADASKNYQNLKPPVYASVSNGTTTNSRTKMLVSVDDYDYKYVPNSNTSIPLPGSSKWAPYATSHKLLQKFIDTTVPMLINDQYLNTKTVGSSNNEALKRWFDSKVQLYTIDGSLLVQGRNAVARLYQALASLRQRTLSTVSVQKVTALSWKTNQTRVRIDYSVGPDATARRYGTRNSATTIATGTDIYTITSSNENSVDSKVDDDVIEPRITRIRQSKLAINNNGNIKEGVWLMRSLAALADAGRLGTSSNNAIFWSDLMDRLGQPNRVVPVDQFTNFATPTTSDTTATTATTRTYKTNTATKTVDSTKASNVPKVTDVAAATMFRVMQQLHSQWQDVATRYNETAAVPAAANIDDDILLTGFLNEPLVRGRTAYINTIGLFLTTLQTALRTGRIVSILKPKTKVELRENGHIRVHVVYRLQVVALVGLPGIDLIPGLERLSSNNVPLTLEFKSDYVCSDKTGQIIQHRLIESRVNGQVTSANVVTRWIQRQLGTENSNEDDEAEQNKSWLQIVADTLRWLDSMNRPTNKDGKYY